MKLQNAIFAVTILTLLSSHVAMTQDLSQRGIVDNLCKKWVLDSMEVKSINKKYPAPANIKGNYTHYKKDGTFDAQDFGIAIKGKWKVDSKKMQITSYDYDNPQLKGNIVFTIIELTENHLAITSEPMSRSQVIMHFKPESEINK